LTKPNEADYSQAQKQLYKKETNDMKYKWNNRLQNKKQNKKKHGKVYNTKPTEYGSR
jgi:hypothetical protein